MQSYSHRHMREASQGLQLSQHVRYKDQCPKTRITVALQYSLKSGRVIPPALFFFSQDFFGNSGSFVVLYKHQDYLFQFCEQCHGYFDRDCIKSINFFGWYGHFNINSSNPRAWGVFPFLCILFNFVHQVLQFSEYRSYTSLVKFIPRYFVLFDAVVNRVAFFLFLMVHYQC